MDGRMVFWLMVYSFAIFIKVSKEQWEKYPGCLGKSLVGKERNLNLPDSSYSASSWFDYRYEPHKAKLYGKYGWAPRYNDNPDDYLQINLSTTRVITAVATQGNGGDKDDKYHKEVKNEWVISYKMNYSDDSSNWISYEDDNGAHKVDGNTDTDKVVRHDFKTPITARYIRFIPLDYKTAKTMRVNVYVSIKIQEAFRVTTLPGRKSIRLTWAIIPCSLFNVTGYTVTLNGNKNFPVNSNKNVYQLSKLKAYTEYNVSVKAKTQQGDDLWSNVKSVRTSIEEPTEAPVIISIEAVSSNCISIALKKPARDTINGPFKGYEISYMPQGGISKNIDVVGDFAKYNLTSLLKYTMYSIRIAVRNTKYIGPQSIERSVRTMEDAPFAPVNLNSLFKPASGLVRPRVVITWRKPFIPNGIIRTYTIIYYLNNMHTTNKNIVTIKEGATSSLTYTITVVSSGTFSYNISASTIKEGPYAVGKSIKIPEYRCPEQSLVGKERNLNTTNISYTASSHFDHRYQPHNSKLYGKYGWAPKDNNNPDDYLQIDLGTPLVITAVATQGNGGDPDRVPHITYNEWVTGYKLQYSNNASNWNSYEDDTHKFKGNADSSSVVRHDLENPITAKYIRFVPTAYHRNKTMRVNVYISLQEAPRIRLLAIGKRSIQLSWTVKQCSPTYPITGYEVKLTGKMRTHERITKKLECTVGNLKPYTEYNVTVRAIKQVGYGVWSNITTTRTDIAEPEEAPAIIKVETKTFQSVTMEWELKHTDLINGPFKGYMIKYKPQGGETKMEEVVCKVVKKCTTHTLTSLRKYTPYSFRVAVMNERLTGPFSTEQHTRTMQDKPDKSPAITSMEPISSESILIKWKKVDRDEIHGPFKAYRISYTPQGRSPDIIDVGDSAAFNLTSLLKYTIYSVTIAVMNEKFVGPQSTELSTRTLEDAPSAPINVNGTLIPAQGSFEPRVVITWDRPREPNGIIRKYTIVYYYNKDTSNSKTVLINGTSDLQYTMNVTTSGVLSFKIRATTIKEGPYQMGNNIEVPSDRKVGPSISPIENKTVTKGEPILLLCNATGDPAPNVSWSKASGTINPSYVSGKELWILSAKLSDAGKYICTAKNDVSMTTVEAFVTVMLRPHSPVPLSTQITHLTINVYWKKPKSHGYPVLMYSVHRVELDQAGQEVKSRTYHVNEDVHHYEAGDIERGKTYKFYVTAWNTHGESVKDHRKSVTVKVQKP